MNKNTLPIVIALILLIIGWYILNDSKREAKKELYVRYADCAKRAVDFAFNKSSQEMRSWTLLQNNYSIDTGLCYGEFSFINNAGGTTKTIYDLLNNKELAFLPSLEVNQLSKSDDPESLIKFIGEYEKKYNGIKNKYLGN